MLNTAILTSILFAIALIGYAFAVYFTVKLTKETKRERYWYLFAVAAFALAIHQILNLLAEFGIITEQQDAPLSLVLHIISGLSMAYASYGIVKTMVTIRKKLE